MAKVVVTGGAGFIGGHIVEALIARGDQVTVFDNLHTGHLTNLGDTLTGVHPAVRLYQDSILNQEALLEACAGATSVFHLAALISVPESMEKPIEYVATNTIGTLRVLEACRLSGVKNIVLSSSAAIYGDNPTIPKLENMIPEPKSPYAVSKLDGEYYFQMYRKQYGLNATSLRYFNVFGPRQDPKSQYAAAVPIFIDRAVKNQDITIFGDGQQTRDFIYVKDVVQANLLAAKRGGDVFNVAWGQRLTIQDLATHIIQLTGSSSKILYLPERSGDIKHSMSDNQKIIQQLGFKASSTLEKGLIATIEYFQDLKNKKLNSII